jgi:hypothetical protein
MASNQPLPEITITPDIWDKTRLIIKDPVLSSFEKGGQSIENVNSAIVYLNDDGEECIPFFACPTQRTFGPSYNYPMGSPEDKQTPENATGVQIQYPATSLATIAKPTEEEAAFMQMIADCEEALAEKGRTECENDDTVVPGVSVNSFTAAEKKGNMSLFVKPTFEFAKKDEDKNGKKIKVADKTKPKRMYVKLITTGSGEKLRVGTPFYGPGDVKCNPMKFANQMGDLSPCLRLDHAYWGAHGKNPHGVALKFLLAEANFTPSAASTKLPSKRMLGKNTAVKEQDGSDDDEVPRRNTKAANIPDGSDDEDPFADPTATDDGVASDEEPAPVPKKKAAAAPVKTAPKTSASAAKPATSKHPVAGAVKKTTTAAAPAKKVAAEPAKTTKAVVPGKKIIRKTE